MPRTSTAIQDAIADAIRLRFELGREIRTARLDAGSSLRTAAVRAGMSHTQLRRIEMGLVEHLTFIQAGSACAAVGLRLTARAVPGSGAPLDAGQLALLGCLRMRLPVLLPVAAEVPLPLPGDRAPGTPSWAPSRSRRRSKPRRDFGTSRRWSADRC